MIRPHSRHCEKAPFHIKIVFVLARRGLRSNLLWSTFGEGISKPSSSALTGPMYTTGNSTEPGTLLRKAALVHGVIVTPTVRGPAGQRHFQVAHGRAAAPG